MQFTLISKYAIIFLILLLILQVNTKDDHRVIDKLNVHSEIKNISGENWTFYSRKTCGFIDRNLYIPNDTFQTVLFLSSQPFSVIIEEDSAVSLLTGLVISKQISSLQAIQIRNSSKVYQINRITKSSLKVINKKQFYVNNNEKQRRYFVGNLSIYSECKTFAFSADYKQIEVQITFYPNSRGQQNIRKIQQHSVKTTNNSQQQQQINDNLHTNVEDEYRVRLKIATTIYCIDGRSIKQANFILSKMYQLLIMCAIVLALSFNVLKNIPSWMRLLTIVGYFVLANHLHDSWYWSLLCSYCMITIIAFYYFFFESRTVTISSREHIFTRSFIMVSLGSAFPLAIKSHLDNENIQHKRILLHLVNFVMLCNALLFTQSMVYIRRFRDAFYYFILIVLTEYIFSHKVQNILLFNLLEIQAFSQPASCKSLFFTIMLIPLCDFFFKSYSSDLIFKFFILIIPIISYPFHIGSSTSFIMGFIFWVVKQLIKGKDIAKMIRHKS